MTMLAVVTLIMVLAVVEVMVLGFLVGRAWDKDDVHAPATSGNPAGGRLYRAHQNSIEQLVLFIPLFFAYCFNTGLQTGILLGVVYLVARALYAAGYLRDSDRRGAGAFLTFAVQVWLAVGAVIGLVVKIARS
jgi:glutathione S-transferase